MMLGLSVRLNTHTYGGEEAEDTVRPAFVASPAVVYSPTVTTGAVTVAPVYLAAPAVLYQPTVLTDAAIVQPDFLASPAVVYAPTLTTGAVTVQPAYLAAIGTVYAPAVTTGAVTVSPDYLASPAVVYEPTVAVGTVIVAPSYLAAVGTIYSPTITTGAVTVQPTYLAAPVVVYAPTVALAGGLWTPADLGSALEFWLDASDASTITETGGAVSAWNDKSGNGHHATQATGSLQPAYSATSFNGLPGITATGDEMELASAVIPSGNISKDIGSTNNSALSIGTADGVTRKNGTYAQDTPMVVGCAWGNNIAHVVNGTVVADETNDQGNVTTFPMTNPGTFFAAVEYKSGGNTFGRYIEGLFIFTRSGSDRDLNAILGELVYTNTELASTTREKLEGYIHHHQDLESLLDAGHPHKSAPPTV